ncbi:MAG: hypothetical protein GY756_08750 [bacterium]|nr:hypothetical protein [bacterium]
MDENVNLEDNSKIVKSKKIIIKLYNSALQHRDSILFASIAIATIISITFMILSIINR